MPVLKRQVILAALHAFAKRNQPVWLQPAHQRVGFGEPGEFFRFPVKFAAGHYDPAWKHTGLPLRNPNAKSPVSAINYTREIRKIDAQTSEVVWRFALPEGTAPLPTAEVCAGVNLPVAGYSSRSIILDDAPLKLPVQSGGATLLAAPCRTGRTLVLPAAGGSVTVTGDYGLLVQDQRRWQRDFYGVRMRIEPPGRKINGGETIALSLNIRYAPWRSIPVPLHAAANRAFHDEVAGDGRGGWTDQGPANDLSAVPQGHALNVGGFTFDIIDPATNGGRAALVFERKQKTSVTLRVPGSPVWSNLCLLHAAAWLAAPGKSVGTVVARYTDGTEMRHEVVSGRDVGDWWTPLPLANAAVGWSGNNASSPVGLYASRFALADKPLAEIRLESTGASMWMIAAMSGSPDDIAFSSVATPLTISAGKNWAPLAHSVAIEPGGVFDFSFLNAGMIPAGVHGPLATTSDGHFEYANRPGRRVRFWGVNLVTGAQYLDKTNADLLAERLARSGYNAVRLHHFDLGLMQPGKPSWDLDTEKLDQLEYLFAALKKQGIHLNIDLFSLRGFSKEELQRFGLDPAMNRGDSRPRFKALIPISDAAFDSWARFARALLLHRNPYTGRTWAEDPALIGICPVNEDTLSEIFLDRYPEIRRRYDALFDAWKKTADQPATFGAFLVDLQKRSDARMLALLRSLDVKALLTGANYKNTIAATYLREHYDYVDNHQYWDHPLFPEKRWAPPFTLGQTSATRYAAQVPRVLMPSRVFGRPYVISEFNYVRPNRHRAEGGVLMPAYASLQDWDALYNYKYANSPGIAMEGVVDRHGIFSIASDPINLLADRVSALIFRRGDIAAARNAVVMTAPPPADAGQEFPHAFSLAGLVNRIGSRTQSSKSSGWVEWTDENIAAVMAEKRFVSDTGEIDLDASVGSLRVVAPRSELFVLPPNAELKGKAVSCIRNGDTFGTMSVVSLDGRLIADSMRLLVLHLTDALPSGMRFSNTDRRRVEDRGRGPFLVERGSAEIALRLSAGGGGEGRLVFGLLMSQGGVSGKLSCAACHPGNGRFPCRPLRLKARNWPTKLCANSACADGAMYSWGGGY